MSKLRVEKVFLGFELYQDDRLVALYRVREEVPRQESPKPCFAPIYLPEGGLVTEYRPKDHLWHTGLYYGWVHANDANLWGGPTYVPDTDQYEWLEDSWGRQAHERFVRIEEHEDGVIVEEALTWRGTDDHVMAEETRLFHFRPLAGFAGSFWRLESRLEPVVATLTIGASRAARYSGLQLRMGPPFAPAAHRSASGLTGHETIMGQPDHWCCVTGHDGGALAIFDHPDNPRYPTPWFTRANLLGAGLLMNGDLTIDRGDVLTLKHGLVLIEGDPGDDWLNQQYERFTAE